MKSIGYTCKSVNLITTGKLVILMKKNCSYYFSFQKPDYYYIDTYGSVETT